MTLKKSQLYSSLRQSCDELRGGMDASQYKDYVLTLPKHVSGRSPRIQISQVQVPDDHLEPNGKMSCGEDAQL